MDNQKFQVNQIYKCDNNYYIVIFITSRYIALRNLKTNKHVYPSPNSVFMDLAIYIGTPETHPELLIW